MRLRTYRSTLLLILVLLPVGRVAGASAYDGRPKLVIELVIDQFRGDYLDRYRADFKTPMGFNLFLERGAYFPNAYYEYANTETAPGHATIGTGAYSDGHNIGVNQWWDLGRSATHQVSSVEDPDFPLVGATADGELGASPRNEQASTLGDEVVLSTGGRARVFGLSLKDRAAILTSGHASAGAFWIDHPSGRWISSTYWGPQLPPWVTAFNRGPEADAARRAAGMPAGGFYEGVGATPAAVKYELDFAQALIEAEKLGRDNVTDVLTISISSTDILGHKVGPDAPEQRAMIDAVDTDLNGFFEWLNTHVGGGMSNVWVALTGDHGVGPVPIVAAREGMPSGAFPNEALDAELNKELNARFATAQPQRFVLGGTLPYVQLDPQAFARVARGEAEAEDAVADLLPRAMAVVEGQAAQASAGKARVLQAANVRRVWTKVQLAQGRVPDTAEGHRMLHSYWSGGGWWVILTPGMYQEAGGGLSGTNHFTPYSYDRHVPLAFYGSRFVPGTYLQYAEPVDIAATFAVLLGVNRPSACVGRVVTEAIRPESHLLGSLAQ